MFCLEGRSWRKDFYEPYKKNRQVALHRTKLTSEEISFWETFDDFKTFLLRKTNCTVMQHNAMKQMILLHGWVQAHPNDNHVIISTDSDFYQLIRP